MKIESNEIDMSIMTHEMISKNYLKAGFEVAICARILCFTEIVFNFEEEKKSISDLSRMLCSKHKVFKNTFARIAE